jgi:hypothetical protein
MGRIIRIICKCNPKYKIIHLVSYTEESGDFSYFGSDIYLEDIKYMETEGIIYRRDFIGRDYNTLRIVDCKCSKSGCCVYNFCVIISDVSRSFRLKNVDIYYQKCI